MSLVNSQSLAYCPSPFCSTTGLYPISRRESSTNVAALSPSLSTVCARLRSLEIPGSPRCKCNDYRCPHLEQFLAGWYLTYGLDPEKWPLSIGAWPGLLAQYEPYAPREDHRDRPLPETHTNALPGPGKIAVLRERWRRGLSLWHPDDAKKQPEKVRRQARRQRKGHDSGRPTSLNVARDEGAQVVLTGGT